MKQVNVASEMWADADYAELIRAMKEVKAGSAAYDDPPATRKMCPDCNRPVAGVFDEGICNTGACGCATSRALCWRGWNGNVCCADSPYAPPRETVKGGS